ncbi:PorV/PorQ family protein [bacterium]
MNPLGSRATAMGGAFTAVANDVSSIYWNPAGLAYGSVTQLTGMHSERFAGMVNLDFIAGTIMIHDKASLGIGYFRLGVDDIPMTRLENIHQTLSAENRPYVEKYMQDLESALFFSYSKSLNSRFFWGTTIKIIHKSMGDYQAWGLGFDGGVLYLPTPSFRIGAALIDGTSTMMAWQNGTKEYILPHLKLGVAYSVMVKQLKIVPTMDVSNLFYRYPDALFHLGNWSQYYHCGIEVDYMNLLALRAGSFRGQLTAGAGLKIAFVQADYCFSKHAELGDSHLISLTLQKTRMPHP